MRLTRSVEDREAMAASQAALEASTRAAESAFALEEAFRSRMDAAAVLRTSLEASQQAVRLAREAVEVALALAMEAPARHSSTA